MTQNFDIAIIGAGPAGLSAAYKILQQNSGARLALIEKTTGRNKRIPCAEGVGVRGFHEIMEPKPSWIRSVVNRLVFHAPDNTTITYTDAKKGYIINRAIMQQELIEHCLSHNVTGLFEKTALQVSLPLADGNRQIMLSDGSAIRARIIIDCSGPVSRFGRCENIVQRSQDLEIAYFSHLEGVSTQTDTIHMFISSTIAPGGYGWAFPRDEQGLNVGIVIGSNFTKKYNIKKLLSSFIAANYPQAKVIRTIAGPIPCYTKRGPIATIGLLKAGDAISAVNPVSRAGISEAMKSGTLAGTMALAMLAARQEKEIYKICKEYERLWFKKLGNRHEKLARVKNSLLSISDEEYNRGASALAQLPTQEITMSRVFMTCLGKFPRLVYAMRHFVM
ncbi:MAG: NAD(P)/FAD-dependent oxidoreductase [Chitinivibrionales bacterium]|nr:NAD(P)/FAD-dependent oxidoreductase [Chitinivibrionales bacterium]